MKLIGFYALMIATLAVVAVGVQAKKLYKYQDENGVWRYTDNKPQGEDAEAESPVETIRIREESEKRVFHNVWVREDVAMNRGLTVVNNYYGPVHVQLTIKCSGCTANGETTDSEQLVVPANSERRAVDIKPTRRGWNASYNLAVVLGDPAARHDDTYHYGLPFPEYDFQLVSQSFNGSFSHREAQNQYAVDFTLPLGTPVTAVRDGVVMGIVEGYTEAGVDPDLADKANVVYLLHDDGTISAYAHLDMYSVKVKPGQKVFRGDMLARSGNTGFSTGPHLHFAILKNDDGEQVSIPYKFANTAGKPFVPVAGQELKHEIGGKVTKRVSDDYRDLYELSQAELAELNDKDTQKGIGGFWKSLVDKVAK